MPVPGDPKMPSLDAAGVVSAVGRGETMKLSMAIAGMSAVMEGPAQVIQPHAERFFALAERAIEHNARIAEKTLQLQALHRHHPTGGAH